MGLILTNDDLDRENQIDRDKAMVFEYFRGQQILVDYPALFKKLDPPPLLHQFAWLIAYHRFHWKDALRWVMEHRQECINHDIEQQRIKHGQDGDAKEGSVGETDRGPIIPGDKG